MFEDFTYQHSKVDRSADLYFRVPHVDRTIVPISNLGGTAIYGAGNGQ